MHSDALRPRLSNRVRMMFWISPGFYGSVAGGNPQNILAPCREDYVLVMFARLW